MQSNLLGISLQSHSDGGVRDAESSLFDALSAELQEINRDTSIPLAEQELARIRQAVTLAPRIVLKGLSVDDDEEPRRQLRAKRKRDGRSSAPSLQEIDRLTTSLERMVSLLLTSQASLVLCDLEGKYERRTLVEMQVNGESSSASTTHEPCLGQRLLSALVKIRANHTLLSDTSAECIARASKAISKYLRAHLRYAARTRFMQQILAEAKVHFTRAMPLSTQQADYIEQTLKPEAHAQDPLTAEWARLTLILRSDASENASTRQTISKGTLIAMQHVWQSDQRSAVARTHAYKNGYQDSHSGGSSSKVTAVSTDMSDVNSRRPDRKLSSLVRTECGSYSFGPPCFVCASRERDDQDISDINDEATRTRMLLRRLHTSVQQETSLLERRKLLSQLRKLTMTLGTYSDLTAVMCMTRAFLVDRKRQIRQLTAMFVPELLENAERLQSSNRATAWIQSTVRSLLSSTAQGLRATALAVLYRLLSLSRGRLERYALCQLVLCSADARGDRAAASQYLLKAAHARKCTFYQVVQPHLKEISASLAFKLVQSPSLLDETCNLLGQSSESFLNQTCRYMLPDLVVASKVDEIRRLSGLLQRDLATLLYENIVEIFSAILVSANPGLGLNCFTNLTGQHKAQLNQSGLIATCGMSLVIKIALELGCNNAARRKRVIIALAGLTVSPTQSSSRSKTVAVASSHQDLVSQCLRKHALGILSTANDVLQESKSRHLVMEKRKVLRALRFTVWYVGPSFKTFAAQLVAILQRFLPISYLSLECLKIWHCFIERLAFKDLEPFVSSFISSIWQNWSHFQEAEKLLVSRILQYLIVDNGPYFAAQLKGWRRLPQDRTLSQARFSLEKIVGKADKLVSTRFALSSIENGDNSARSYMFSLLKQRWHSINNHALEKDGDMRTILQVLLRYLIRTEIEDETNIETCITILGRIGAIDTNCIKFDLQPEVFIVQNGFSDIAECQAFAVFLINNLLVDAFKSTDDGSLQALVAYAMQELLKIAGFGPELLKTEETISIESSVTDMRKRWKMLPQRTKEIAMPFLESRYAVPYSEHALPQPPFFMAVDTYRKWLSVFAGAMIRMLSDPMAQSTFACFLHILSRTDSSRFAEFILPHIFLQNVVHGSQANRDTLLSEVEIILHEAQSKDAHASGCMTYAHQCAQQVFLLYDHYNAWKRKSLTKKDTERHSKATPVDKAAQNSSSIVDDSVTFNINRPDVAEAALRAGSNARALLLYERLVFEQAQHQNPPNLEIIRKMQVLYFNMEEADGLEGLTAYFVAPSIEQQILAHEAAQRWSSAQTCYEVSLQSQPENLSYHVGMLQCLKNLGHWESVLTRSEAALALKPEWASRLAPFLIESAYMNNDWSRMEGYLAKSSNVSYDLLVARLLTALKNNDDSTWTTTLKDARLFVAQELTQSRSYRSAYGAMIRAHVLQDMESIKENPAVELTSLLARVSRAEAAHNVHEQLTNSIRAAIQSHARLTENQKGDALCHIYLFSSRIARKAGLLQTAYAKLLQVPNRAAAWVLEYAKWLYSDGQSQRAMCELRSLISPYQDKKSGAALAEPVKKAALLYARWIEQTGHSEHTAIKNAYDFAVHLRSRHESVYYHLGSYFYKLLQSSGAQNKPKKFAFDKPPTDLETGFIYSTCKYFTNAAIYGYKYIYQTLPRILSLWLDLGARPEVLSFKSSSTKSEEINVTVRRFEKISISLVPQLQKEMALDRWMTAWPQLISRIGHQNEIAWAALQSIIMNLLCKYPQQCIWALIPVSRSKVKVRSSRAGHVLECSSTRSSSLLRQLNNEARILASALARLCSVEMKERQTQLSLAHSCESLATLGPLSLMIPLQDSMTVELSGGSNAAPFRAESIGIKGFEDSVQVMQSLAKPRKLTICGTDGRSYPFLAKPKDDLRKDMRMMQLSSLINMLLERELPTSRRALKIRTYAVVPLDEDSGLLQWVSDTKSFRQIVAQLYKSINIPIINAEIKSMLEDKSKSEQQANFVTKVLPKYPPIFHQHFVDSFPQPAHWLQARTNYTRTAAVMSIIGFVLGLGDRHGENILLDETSGDCIHVDFDCLFEKGQALKIAEQVPFRLTQNVVAGMGVMRYEGFYRTAAEVTLQAVKRNSESLLSVLETFVHDPLVEWTSQRRRESARTDAHSDFNEQATRHLHVVQRKLSGFVPKNTHKEEGEVLPFSTEGQVEELIKRATDPVNLCRMYVGWMAWL